MNQIPLGPEAGVLITALREFISSVTKHSRLRPQNTIDVSLAEGTARQLEGALC